MKAWIENNQIRDICHGDPNQSYHPDIAQLYTTDVPDDAENGDGWVNNQLVKPVIVEPIFVEPIIIPPTISAVAFRNLFSITEEVDITASVDPIIKVIWSRFSDSKVLNIDMSLKSVQDALTYLTTSNIIAVGRKAQILTGVPV